jgi:hypothetical protein
VVSKPPLEPNLCVGRQIEILEIVYYSCGLNLPSALILGPIEGFETTSNGGWGPIEDKLGRIP